MNVFYIHTHDSGRVISPYGYKTPTPNLEDLSKEALVFQNCFCAGPTCSPSRAAMLTGTYPHQNGMLGLAHRGFSIDYSKHLVQYLNKNQYYTALCGIQHESGWYLDIEGTGNQIGYTEVLTRPNDRYRQEDLVLWDQENAGQVCEWLKKYDRDQPFFLSYGMFSTHRIFPDAVDPEISENTAVPPYPVPNSPETRHDFARYLTSLKSADKCIGMVLGALKESGHWEDTIIIFTTDHGLANPYSKCTLFDSGIGVSMIFRVPGCPASGRTTETLISQIDLFPTLCELLNLKKPDYLEGSSFASCFQEPKRKVRDEAFAEINFHTSYEPARCVRTKRYKYIRYYDTGYLKTNLSNIDESETKAYYMEHGLTQQVKYEEAFYDLIYDPGERNNLIGRAEYQGILAEMRKKLHKHMEQTNDYLLHGHIQILPEWKVNKRECLKASSKNTEDYVSLGMKKQG